MKSQALPSTLRDRASAFRKFSGILLYVPAIYVPVDQIHRKIELGILYVKADSDLGQVGHTHGSITKQQKL